MNTQNQIKSTEATNEILNDPNFGPRLDPAPHPINVARQRTADLVRNISDNTKLALRRRRDEIDNTIARIEKSELALTHYIGEFAKFNHEGLELASEIQKLLEEIATPFKADPPATLTQEGPQS